MCVYVPQTWRRLSLRKSWRAGQNCCGCWTPWRMRWYGPSHERVYLCNSSPFALLTYSCCFHISGISGTVSFLFCYLIRCVNFSNPVKSRWVLQVVAVQPFQVKSFCQLAVCVTHNQPLFYFLWSAVTKAWSTFPVWSGRTLSCCMTCCWRCSTPTRLTADACPVVHTLTPGSRPRRIHPRPLSSTVPLLNISHRWLSHSAARSESLP